MRILNTVAALTFFLNASVFAQDFPIGDWVVVKSIPGLQIAKVSAGESAAGVLCNLASKLCTAYVIPNSTCDDGDKYPVLVNSLTGAFTSVTTCRHITSSLRVLEIDEYSQMISAFESGGEVGFATPMRNGQFKVVRFSTVGATAALKVATTLPDTPPPSPRPPAKNAQYL